MNKALLLALMVLGCSDPFFGGSDEPIVPMSVTLSYALTDAMYHHDSQRWECNFTLTAKASGEHSDEFAYWETSVMRRVNWSDQDDTQPQITFSPVMLQDLWGSDRIRAGEILTSTPEVHGPSGIAQGFLLEWIFRLGMSDGSHQSKTLRVNC